MTVSRMQFGVMQRGVVPWAEDMRARFEELMEQARLLEALGYDSITKGSHFSTYPHREMMQIPYLCRVMAEVPSLRLNAGIVLLALHNPLEVAEYFATMDLMSNGRTIFGCALGYRPVEFEGFGVEKGQGVRRLEENLEAITQLWSGEAVTMRGSHFNLVEARLSLGRGPSERRRMGMALGQWIHALSTLGRADQGRALADRFLQELHPRHSRSLFEAVVLDLESSWMRSPHDPASQRTVGQLLRWYDEIEDRVQEGRHRKLRGAIAALRRVFAAARAPTPPPGTPAG